MIIRSQSKRCIVRFERLDTIEVTTRGDRVCLESYNGSTETFAVLGAYSTEEKAIKVLNAIQCAYLSNATAIQMPKDSEVE